MADVSGERARRIGAAVGLALAGSALTYFVVHREAEHRALDAEARAASRLAECEEGSVTHRIELEGELASCRLDRVHGRCGAIGDHVGDATVTAVQGRNDVQVAQVCSVELDWNSDPIEGCRAFVRCGELRLYGDLGEGYFECTVDEDGIVHGQDAEPTSAGQGDPRMTIDRESAEITVSDDSPGWSVTLSIPALRQAALEAD